MQLLDPRFYIVVHQQEVSDSSDPHKIPSDIVFPDSHTISINAQPLNSSGSDIVPLNHPPTVVIGNGEGTDSHIFPIDTEPLNWSGSDIDPLNPPPLVVIGNGESTDSSAVSIEVVPSNTPTVEPVPSSSASDETQGLQSTLHRRITTAPSDQWYRFKEVGELDLGGINLEPTRGNALPDTEEMIKEGRDSMTQSSPLSEQHGSEEALADMPNQSSSIEGTLNLESESFRKQLPHRHTKVLKLELYNKKAKTKAMRIINNISGNILAILIFASGTCNSTGVESVRMDMKNKKMIVIGDMDPVDIVIKLRKLFGPAKEPENNEERAAQERKEEPKKADGHKKKDKKKDGPEKDEMAKLLRPYYYTTFEDENPNACVII
ncbi:hypothetical protein JRO89_XS02G0257600 [Xanthoceras sorbifolium]|uniref:Uncharacterized protein n=1 Tax=Xanthoceras sorbifolium TaxID=99658 RepID=A0ABQ8IGZ0_9ROSI|nr:hypothetical protein JRO89_XS02G0257600 [Xanthoceras sorbifolium]